MPEKAKKAQKNAQNKPKKALKIPNPPEYFCGYSLKKWNELAPIFAEKNMLNEADLSAFELLCMHYGDAMSLYDAMIEEGGSMAGYLSGRNSQTMGEYLAYHKAITAYSKMLIEFGLTPASKKKVPSPEVVEEDDPLTKMINN
ncbi:P27 family phage terminase small subunit [Brachyspira pilosicoli]|uniref:P27 family phage terminase small subunit n=1 Tax=Brachyspira pilosicoli TaxID=52584 RepID=UPI00255CA9B6|nr:P27 family phage terminase small subunit [Brachyspira pilosicoli]